LKFWERNHLSIVNIWNGINESYNYRQGRR
jgi:hypothetical protein